MKLTTLQIQRLRAKAHTLKPTVIIGNNGLTEAVQLEIDTTLSAHELIKIRVNAPTKEDREAIIAAICTEQQAHRVQAIGHIAVIYRKRKGD